MAVKRDLPIGSDSAKSERDRWDEFAKADPYAYITGEFNRLPTEQRVATFFESGEAEAHAILTAVQPWLRNTRLAVDLGCGVGRVAFPMAQRFETVIGVDGSPAMLHQLRGNCRERGLSNVRTMSADEAWDRETADLLYSVNVFQHIEDWGTLDRYTKSIARGIGGGGVAYLHFDTRPSSVAYRVKTAMPDRVLPKPWRRGIRRIRRPRADIVGLLNANALAIVREYHPDTERNVFIVRATG